ncbi:hypothetical protein BDZ89DRAFT_1072493, partial [Hymenopellis radicata]
MACGGATPSLRALTPEHCPKCSERMYSRSISASTTLVLVKMHASIDTHQSATPGQHEGITIPRYTSSQRREAPIPSLHKQL